MLNWELEAFSFIQRQSLSTTPLERDKELFTGMVNDSNLKYQITQAGILLSFCHKINDWAFS